MHASQTSRRVTLVLLLATLGALGCPTGCPNLDGTQRRGDNLQCGGNRNDLASPDAGAGTQCVAQGEIGVRCTEDVTVVGEVDVAWVIDNSGSMAEETKGIQDNVNRFVSAIKQTGVDPHVVFVTARTGGSYTINAPMTAEVMQVDTEVGSTDAPEILVDSYMQFEAFFRDNAKRHVIFVTDDNSTQSARAFLTVSDNLPKLSGRTVHAVAGFSQVDCPDIAAVGSVYQDLTQLTGGIRVPICCPDYGALVDVLAAELSLSGLSITLTHDASPSTVKVFEVADVGDGGPPVVTPILMGWSYDASRRAVVFEAAAKRPSGTHLRVTYAART